MSSDKGNDRFLQYGGQAVIEGVMMRSPNYFAVACRKPDGGIVVQEEPVDRTIMGKLKWLNKPILRGTLALIDAMALGMKALNFAARVQTDETSAEKSSDSKIGAASPVSGSATSQKVAINDIAIGATMIFSVLFGIGLFVALPTLLTQVIQPWLGIAPKAILSYKQQVWLNFADAVIKIVIFLSYIALIARMENIRRVFQYHGAEHKAINTLESGKPLTVANCMEASRIHPRCGTSFIVIVLIVSALVHSIFPRPPMYLARLGLHIMLIPAVAGVAYETIKMAGKYRHIAWTHWVLAPGLWSQRLTTREPDAEHIEVAISSLQAVLDKEASAAQPASLAAVA